MSILSERRAFRPYGMAGGTGGQRGLNLLRVAGDGSNAFRFINLGGKNTVHVNSSDRFSNTTKSNIFFQTIYFYRGHRVRLLIFTPGGGGYGMTGASTEGVGEGDGRTEESEGSKKRARLSLTGGSLNQYTLRQETV